MPTFIMRTGAMPTRSLKRKAKVKVELSSGNVYADLGLPNAEERLAKADLVIRIYDVITSRGLTQRDAARLLGIDQPKVSALLRGKFDGFSTDRLFRFLNRLGQDGWEVCAFDVSLAGRTLLLKRKKV